MTKNEMESIARNAASAWCKCDKCREISFIGENCGQPNKACMKWYDGYKTALIALESLERQAADIETLREWVVRRANEAKENNHPDNYYLCQDLLIYIASLKIKNK